MENQDSTKSLFDLRIDENTRQSLKRTANWGGIAAVFSITGSLLSVIRYFVMKDRPKTNPFEGFTEIKMQPSNNGNLASVVLAVIIGFFLFYFLNKFSRSTKAGIDGNNQQLINEGLGGLSTYFKIIGVILIICIFFVGLALLVGVGSKI
jgi:small-conductance mechanosensitive channel